MEELGGLRKAKITTEDSRENSSTSNRLNMNAILIILGIAIIISLLIILYNKILKNNNSLTHYDYIIVGSGLYGATFNYIAKKMGKKTLFYYIIKEKSKRTKRKNKFISLRLFNSWSRLIRFFL